MRFTKIISGGQTGVDRAALDVALELGMNCGGWCPRGRRAEDGSLPQRYPLTETPLQKYSQRTAWNVRDSDGTLVLTRGQAKGGTALTVNLAARYGKPRLVLDLTTEPHPAVVHEWAARNCVRTLNVAGPRETENRGIYEQAAAFLRKALSCGASSASDETP
jgi:hypothetical protein